MSDRSMVRAVIGPPFEDVVEVQSLLDPDRVLAALREARSDSFSSFSTCSLQHVRYRPGRSCTAAYRFSGDDPGESPLAIYIRFNTPEDFPKTRREVADRPWRPGRVLPGPLIIEAWRATAFEFPNDARLSSLTLFDRPGALNDLLQPASAASRDGGWRLRLQRPESILRYKPESRCVARFVLDPPGRGRADGSVLLRFEQPRKTARHALLLTEARRRLADAAWVSTPVCIAAAVEEGVSAYTWREGMPLNDALRYEGGGRSAFRTGRALAAWHGAPSANLSVRTAGDMLKRARGTAAELGRVLPGEKPRIDEIMRRAERLQNELSPSPSGMLHGDFHPGQVIEGEQRIWLVDADGLCAGEVAIDLGNFLAQVRLQAHRGHVHDDRVKDRFLEGYQAGDGPRVPPRRIALFSALTCLELAHKQFRRLKPDWPAQAELLLRLALEDLDG